MAAKLLFNENLAPRLVRDVDDLFPGSAHVLDLGLARALAETIWDRAASDGFVLVTQDDDFRQRRLLRGHPPKVIWLRVGNCPSSSIAELLRDPHHDIAAFVDDPEAAFLVLMRRR